MFHLQLVEIYSRCFIVPKLNLCEGLVDIVGLLYCYVKTELEKLLQSYFTVIVCE